MQNIDLIVESLNVEVSKFSGVNLDSKLFFDTIRSLEEENRLTVFCTSLLMGKPRLTAECYSLKKVMNRGPLTVQITDSFKVSFTPHEDGCDFRAEVLRVKGLFF